MGRLTDEQWRSVARSVQREMARRAPDWTDHAGDDPGITMLELLAYTLTDLGDRGRPLDEDGRRLAQRVIGLVQAFAAEGPADCPPGLQRVDYFSGMVLGVADFAAEQDYVRQGTQRRNRLLHGAGIASGLGVTLGGSPDGPQVTIAPGLALSPLGEEIAVEAPFGLALPPPAQGASLLVLLRYVELPCRPVPAGDGQADLRFSRIAETFGATLAGVADDGAIVLARLTCPDTQWTIDHELTPARIR